MSLSRFSQMVSLCLGVSVLLVGPGVASTTPKPYQWKTPQARAAILAKSPELYRDNKGESQSLVKLACHGTGKVVMHRFTSFRCAAAFTGGASGVIVAKTRRAGGLCWSLTATVPGACLAGGERAAGSMREAFLSWRSSLTVSPAYTACVASGIGFYSCWWSDTVTMHRGTVVFSPAPRVKMLS